MSKYTTEVRYICEQTAGLGESVGADSVDGIISQSWVQVIGKNWPCWSVEQNGETYTYHEVLAKKILKHYYTREIGFETVGLWKLKLNTKLNEIMPYYVNLYETVEKKYDWLRDTDYYRQHEGSGEGTNKETTEDSGEYSSENAGTNWRVYSDTPQGSLMNVQNETYLTDATKQTTNGTANGENSANRERNGEYNNTDEYLDHIYGKMPGKSFTSLMKEYRDSIINIDIMIIDELGDLFIKLW